MNISYDVDVEEIDENTYIFSVNAKDKLNPFEILHEFNTLGKKISEEERVIEQLKDQLRIHKIRFDGLKEVVKKIRNKDKQPEEETKKED
jgi:hypothetical protein